MSFVLQFGLGLLDKVKTLDYALAQSATELGQQKESHIAQTKRVGQLEQMLQSKEAHNSQLAKELDEAHQALDQALSAARQAESSKQSELRRAEDLALHRDDSSLRHEQEIAATSDAMAAAQTATRKFHRE